MDDYYPAYKGGHLLIGGGIAEQPARYLALIRHIRTLEQDAQRVFDELQAKNDETGGTDGE